MAAHCLDKKVAAFAQTPCAGEDDSECLGAVAGTKLGESSQIQTIRVANGLCQQSRIAFKGFFHMLRRDCDTVSYRVTGQFAGNRQSAWTLRARDSGQNLVLG